MNLGSAFATSVRSSSGKPAIFWGEEVISYDELWGWDMRPIIKTLKIRASAAGPPTEEAP